MKKRTFYTLALLIFLTISLQAETFRFFYVKGDKYRMINQITQLVYYNGEIHHRADFLTKVAIEVLNTKKTSGNISAHFQMSERVFGQEGSYNLNEEFISMFKRDELGNMTIDSYYFMPTTRNIPLFPQQDIKQGYTWTAMGQEVHDFRPYGVVQPYNFPVDVKYTYVGKKTVDGKEIDQFQIEYSVFHDVKGIDTNQSEFYPVRIVGEIIQDYYFDTLNGKPHALDEYFDFIYFFSTGDYVEFLSEAKGTVIAAPIMDKKKTTEDIKKDIEKEDIDDVKVEEDDEGIKLTLENIQFQPDSDVLYPAEQEKLRKIGEILKKYPDRDILVMGHAAKLGTDEYLQKLSERRAKAVADYLIYLGVRKASQMTVVGKGAKEPIATNETEEGRIKNRRVEIYLLEN